MKRRTFLTGGAAAVAGLSTHSANAQYAPPLKQPSTTGVGIRHTDRLKEGAQYLLEVPRPGSTPLATLLTVVRCDENAGGWFESEMAPGDVLEVAAELAHRRAPRASRLRRLRALAIAASAALAAVVATFLL